MNNLSKMIDDLGQLQANIAKLEREEKALKAAFAELAAATYEGERFALTISEFPTTTYDNAAIRAKCSAQLLKAHEKVTQTRRLSVKVRKDAMAEVAA